MRITDSICRSTKPAPTLTDISDDGTPLTFRIKSDGTKLFIWRGRIAGKQTKRIIGTYPDMTLADARAEALRLRVEAKSPEPKLAPVVHPHHRPAKVTIASVLERYDREKLSELASGENVKRSFEKRIVPDLGDIALVDLKRKTINAHFNKLRDEGFDGVGLNRLLANFKAFLTWCVKEDLIEYNPATTIDKKVKEKLRDRMLKDWELAAIQHAIPDCGQYADPLSLLLHSGVRRNNIFALTWGEVIERDGEIELHIQHTKNGEGHIVWLSPQARNFLPDRPDDASEEDRVWPTVCLAPGKLYPKLYGLTDKAAGKPLADWRLHDFRETLTTWVADQVGRGNHYFSDRAIQALLTHKVGGVTRRHYNKSNALAERIEIMTIWSNYLDECAAKFPKKIMRSNQE